MPDPLTEIPDRAAFKAAEVCEIAQIPPYVLRSWEKEFPGLGVETKAGGPKVYRRADVEHVLRIKHLLFAEGLTLAGARRKLEGEPPPEAEAEVTLPVPEEVRTKVATVKRELRSLLDLLSSGGSTVSPAPAAPEVSPSAPDKREAVGPTPASGPVVSTWPPVSGKAGEPAPAKPAATEGADLPLLEGRPDATPAAPRAKRARRPAKG